MDKTWKEAKENATPGGRAGPPTDKKERETKRRKLLKGLKKFTGAADTGERKFKGWSDSGHRVFQKTTKEIKEDVNNGKYTAWEKAFRQVSLMRLREFETTRSMVVEKYAVDKSVVWEL
jgi:hypothetical protein